MEGMPEGDRYAWVRVAQYQREHPGTAICLVEGWWRAWIPKPGGDPAEGTEATPERHLGDLLERLEQLGLGAGDGADDQCCGGDGGAACDDVEGA